MYVLLRGPDDFLKFQCAAVEGRAVKDFAWGSPPGGYPCLVDYLFLGSNRVACCFVYPADARLLLEAVPAARPTSGGIDQDAFNRQTAALLLAVVQLLVTTGITTEARFEALTTTHLASVDQWAQEEHDAVLQGSDDRAQRRTLERLYPENDA